jgi:hypothetical protein
MPGTDDEKRRRTTIVIGAETMRRIEHVAVDARVPMTRVLEALLELALDDPATMDRIIPLAKTIEDEYRSGTR